MNTIVFRSSTLSVLLAFCLPLAAQTVRFEARGEADVAAEEKAMAEAAVARHVIGVPSGDKGQIVFFRPARSAGTVIDFEVRESGTGLVVLPSGSYFVVAVPPGTHTYTADAETTGVLTVEVKPGKTHYVKATSSGGTNVRPRLSRSDAVAFLGAATGKRKRIQ